MTAKINEFDYTAILLKIWDMQNYSGYVFDTLKLQIIWQYDMTDIYKENRSESEKGEVSQSIRQDDQIRWLSRVI